MACKALPLTLDLTALVKQAAVTLKQCIGAADGKNDMPMGISSSSDHIPMQVFVTRADWSRRALTQPEMMDPIQGGRFNTTEIHCTEYHSAVRKGVLHSSLLPKQCVYLSNNIVSACAWASSA